MSPTGPRIGAVVLAAGRSERMGAPKALCRLGGRTLLSIALANMEDPRIADRVVVVEDAAGAIARAVASARIAVNPRSDLGLAESVRSGWRALGEVPPACAILPVDAALVRPADVAQLLDAFVSEEDPAIRVWVPSFAGRRGHPVILHGALRSELDALAPAAPLHRLVRADARRVRHVMAIHDGVLQDVDTPEDLAAAEVRLSVSGGGAGC